MMSKPAWKKVVIPFLIILFPVAFWLVLITGKNHFRTLPYYGPLTISGSGDTTYHQVGSFTLVNQEGRTVTEKDLEGKMIVANFFFSTCKTVCPDMTSQMARLQSKIGSDKDVHLLSFTIDPEHDSVSVLAAYAKEAGADNSRWWFLTGVKDSIYNLAREGFLVSAARVEGAEDFFHSQDLILIDKQRRIRAMVDGTSHLEVDSLFDKIKLLRFGDEIKN